MWFFSSIESTSRSEPASRDRHERHSLFDVLKELHHHHLSHSFVRSLVKFSSAMSNASRRSSSSSSSRVERSSHASPSPPPFVLRSPLVSPTPPPSLASLSAAITSSSETGAAVDARATAAAPPRNLDPEWLADPASSG